MFRNERAILLYYEKHGPFNLSGYPPWARSYGSKNTDGWRDNVPDDKPPVLVLVPIVP